MPSFKPSIPLLVIAVAVILISGVMLLDRPRDYDYDAVYRVDHKMRGKTFRSDYKSGQELMEEQPASIRGTRIGGVLMLGFGIFIGYLALRERRS